MSLMGSSVNWTQSRKSMSLKIGQQKSLYRNKKKGKKNEKKKKKGISKNSGTISKGLKSEYQKGKK